MAAGQNSPTFGRWQEKKDVKSDKSRSRRESVVSVHVLLEASACNQSTANFPRRFPTLHPSAVQCIVNVLLWTVSIGISSYTSNPFIDFISSIIPSLTSCSVNSGSTWPKHGSVSASSCLNSSVSSFLATRTSVSPIVTEQTQAVKAVTSNKAPTVRHLCSWMSSSEKSSVTIRFGCGSRSVGVHEMGCSLQFWFPYRLLALVQCPQSRVPEVLGFVQKNPMTAEEQKWCQGYPKVLRSVFCVVSCSIFLTELHVAQYELCAWYHFQTPGSRPLQCLCLTRCLHTRQCQLCHTVYQAFETKQFHQIHTVQFDSPFSIFENRKFDHLHVSCIDSVKNVNVWQSMGKCRHSKWSLCPSGLAVAVEEPSLVRTVSFAFFLWNHVPVSSLAEWLSRSLHLVLSWCQ